MSSYLNSKDVYEFMTRVKHSKGKERISIIMEKMCGCELPKIVHEYIESHKNEINTDMDADKFFDEYCNKIRIANKLSIK